MSTFCGRMKEYSEISIDRFDGDNLYSTVFFLSHCHRDHMIGLSRRAFSERIQSSNNIYLYMSDVSKVLLLGDNTYNFQHLEPHIRTFQIRRPSTITIPCNTLNDKPKLVSVTLLPAGHCPGSVMFLFEGNEGTVLYTGDFRWERDKAASLSEFHNELGIKPIKSLYIDTTFCVPNALHFPSRFQCVEVTAQLVKEWLALSRSHFVYIASPMYYGHEHLQVEIFKHTKQPIHTSDWKYSIYTQIQDLAMAYTTDPTSRIHACGLKRKLNSKSYLPCGHLFDTEDEDAKLLVVRPSTMWFTMSTIRSEKLVQEPTKSSDPHRVCYALHSSYSEIKNFVSYLNPDRVFPNVIPNQEVNSQMVQARLNSFLKPRDISLTKESGHSSLGNLNVKLSVKRIRSPSLSGSEELLFDSPVKRPKPLDSIQDAVRGAQILADDKPKTKGLDSSGKRMKLDIDKQESYKQNIEDKKNNESLIFSGSSLSTNHNVDDSLIPSEKVPQSDNKFQCPSPIRSDHNTVHSSSPTRGDHSTVHSSSPTRSNHSTVHSSSPTRSNHSTVHSSSPTRSNHSTAHSSSPTRSYHSKVHSSSTTRGDHSTVHSSPTRSNHSAVHSLSPIDSHSSYQGSDGGGSEMDLFESPVKGCNNGDDNALNGEVSSLETLLAKDNEIIKSWEDEEEAYRLYISSDESDQDEDGTGSDVKILDHIVSDVTASDSFVNGTKDSIVSYVTASDYFVNGIQANTVSDVTASDCSVNGTKADIVSDVPACDSFVNGTKANIVNNVTESDSSVNGVKDKTVNNVTESDSSVNGVKDKTENGACVNGMITDVKRYSPVFKRKLSTVITENGICSSVKDTSDYYLDLDKSIASIREINKIMPTDIESEPSEGRMLHHTKKPKLLIPSGKGHNSNPRKLNKLNSDNNKIDKYDKTDVMIITKDTNQSKHLLLSCDDGSSFQQEDQTSQITHQSKPCRVSPIIDIDSDSDATLPPSQNMLTSHYDSDSDVEILGEGLNEQSGGVKNEFKPRFNISPVSKSNNDNFIDLTDEFENV